jgi:initiation factor 1A
MVKNTTGGNRHKKQKNNVLKQKRPLELKEDGEDYGQIINILGGSWVTVRKLGTEKEFRCRVRHAKGIGKMSKLDIVLYALRDFENKPVGDIIVIYDLDEVNILKKDNHIPTDTIVDDLFVNEDDNDEEEDEDEDEDEDDIKLRNENKLKNELAIRDSRNNKENVNVEIEINIDDI